MPKTLAGSCGMTGSFTLNDSDTGAVTVQSLASNKTVVTAPSPLPAAPADPGWNVNNIYSTSFYRAEFTGIDASTGVTITFSSMSDALCGAKALTKLHTLTIENLGGQDLRLDWSALVGGTSAFFIIPKYSKMRLEIPMDGLNKGATTGITLKSATSTTSAYVVISYS